MYIFTIKKNYKCWLLKCRKRQFVLQIYMEIFVEKVIYLHLLYLFPGNLCFATSFIVLVKSKTVLCHLPKMFQNNFEIFEVMLGPILAFEMLTIFPQF